MKRLILILFFVPTLVQAVGSTSSFSNDIDLDVYDPTVSTRAPKSDDHEFAMFDEVRIHTGITYVSSFQELINRGSRERGGTRGISLHFGIDLFSENWIAEGVLVSFPEADWGAAKVASNGFELRLAYEEALLKAVTGKLGAGVASRVFSVKTASEERTFNSGASVFFGGLDYWASGMLSIGVELSHHMAMSSAEDPTSFDLGVRLNGHF